VGSRPLLIQESLSKEQLPSDTQSVMSLLDVQGAAITRIEHIRKTEAAASAAKARRPRSKSYGGLVDGE
jgi:hypothetical protein